MNRFDWVSVHDLARQGLSIRKIAQRLQMHRRQVRRLLKVAKPQDLSREVVLRPSMLNPHRGWIMGKLEQYPELTAQRIFRMLKDDRGFTGGSSIVRELVAKLRPRQPKAKFTLYFAPGESAQADWGVWKSVDVEGTRRQINFFVMVLAHSRMIYAELSFGTAMEHWLSCHRHAFEFFGGVPKNVRVDCCKTAVCGWRPDGTAIITPGYAAFAADYKFNVDDCTPHSPEQKGRVENGVKYLKGAFFAGREPTSMPAMQAALRDWFENEANHRIHGTTGLRPIESFKAEEHRHLQPLPAMPTDCGVEHQVCADNRFRVTLDTNRYSVPSAFASRRVIMCTYHDRVVVRSAVERKVLADHLRSYGRRQNILDPKHEQDLILATRHAHDKRLLETFLSLGSATERYLSGLQERRPDWRSHLRRINALADAYGRDETARLIADALEHGAFGADYIQNILSFRTREPSAPGPLHVTRRQDLLEISIPSPDLEIYSNNTAKEHPP